MKTIDRLSSTPDLGNFTRMTRDDFRFRDLSKNVQHLKVKQPSLRERVTQVSHFAKLEKYAATNEEQLRTGVRVIALPGFAYEQARVFATLIEKYIEEYHRSLALVRLDHYPDTKSLEALVNKAIKRMSPRALLNYPEVVIAGATRCELRSSLAKERDDTGSRIATLRSALIEQRVLRFVYPANSSRDEITRRVKVRAIYVLNGEPEFFRAEYFAGIRSYSLRKVSKALMEDTSVKYLTPPMALRLTLQPKFDAPLVDLVREA